MDTATATIDATVEIVPAPIIPTLTVGKSTKAYIASVNDTVHLFGRDRTQEGKERKGITHVILRGRAPSVELSAQLGQEGFTIPAEPDRIFGGQSLLLALQGQAIRGFIIPQRLRKSILTSIAKHGGIDLEG
jgi:hypothetical protein